MNSEQPKNEEEGVLLKAMKNMSLKNVATQKSFPLTQEFSASHPPPPVLKPHTYNIKKKSFIIPPDIDLFSLDD